MKKSILLITLIGIIHSVFPWVTYPFEDMAFGCTFIFENSHGQIVYSGTRPSEDTIPHFFNIFDENGSHLKSSHCYPDSTLTFSSPYPNQIVEIGDRIYCCAIHDGFIPGLSAGISIVDSSLNIISSRIFTPPLSGSRSYIGRVIKYNENEALILISYVTNPGNPYIHFVRIDTLCNILDEKVVNTIYTGRINIPQSETIYLQEDGSVILVANQSTDSLNSKVMVDFSFEESVTIHYIDTLISGEMSPKMVECSDGDYLLLWYRDELMISPFRSLYKLNSDYEIIWKIRIEETELTRVNNVYEHSSGKIIVTGIDSWWEGANRLFAIAEYTSDGEFIRKIVPREDLRDSLKFTPYSMTTQCSNGDFIFVGVVDKPISDTDSVRLTLILRIDSLYNDVSFPDQITESPKLPDLLQLTFSPNPFNPVLRVNTHEDANITIFDTQGRMIANLGKERTWEPDIATGVYIVRSVYGELERCEKVVLLK